LIVLFFLTLLNDEIFVSDFYNHRIQTFNAETGKYIRMIGNGKGDGKGQLFDPKGLCISNQRLYIVENENNRISVFNHLNGQFMTSFGCQGDGPSQFNSPETLYFHNNSLYVVDSNNSRIQIFTSEGKYISEIKGNNKESNLSNPRGIMIYESEIFISERDGNRISIWDLQNKRYVRSLGEKGNGDGEFDRPWNIRMISQNQMIVCDSGNNRLQIFT